MSPPPPTIAGPYEPKWTQMLDLPAAACTQISMILAEAKLIRVELRVAAALAPVPRPCCLSLARPARIWSRLRLGRALPRRSPWRPTSPSRSPESPLSLVEALGRTSPKRWLAAYRAGGFTYRERSMWAAHCLGGAADKRQVRVDRGQPRRLILASGTGP